MTRGDVYLVKGKGDYGKIRPTVIVQCTQSIEAAATVTVCLITSRIIENSAIRLTLEPSQDNGLEMTSQVQLDKIQTFPKQRFVDHVGRLTDSNMSAVDLGIATHLNLYALAPSQE